MFKRIKKLFKNDYVSPLNIETCKERLTYEYRAKLRELGEYHSDDWFGWYTTIRTNKKGVIVINSIFTRFSFAYRFTLEESGEGTFLRCKHNPFSGFALFFPALITVMLFACALYELANLIAEPGSSQATLAGILAFFVPLFMTCVLLECFARSTVNKALTRLVDAKPMC